MGSYDVARGGRSDSEYKAEVLKGKANEKIAAEHFAFQWRMQYPDLPFQLEPVPQPLWIRDDEGSWIYEPDFTITQNQTQYLEVKTCIIDNPKYLFFKVSQIHHMIEKYPGWILFAMPSMFSIIRPQFVGRYFDLMQPCPQLDNKLTYYLKPGHCQWHTWLTVPPFVDKQGELLVL